MQNRVTLEGVVFNPKISKTKEGTPYLRFILAVKSQVQEAGEMHKRTDYFPVRVLRYDLIDYFNAYVQKQGSVVIEGSLHSTIDVPHEGFLSNNAEVHVGFPDDRLEIMLRVVS